MTEEEWEAVYSQFEGLYDDREALLDAVTDATLQALRVPGVPGSVTASDGTSSNGVDVTWTFPSAGSGGSADSYIVSREEKGKSGTLTVLTNGVVGTAWTDSTADPGADYTYYVRGRTFDVLGASEVGNFGKWSAVKKVKVP